MIQNLPTITDEFMKENMTKTKTYTIALLKSGPNRHMPGVEKIIWEHGRRNFALREAGILSIVCPVPGDGYLDGVGIFNVSVDELKIIMDEDPGVKEGVFTYEIHQVRSFPGDSLP
jgi:hypothetical protein